MLRGLIFDLDGVITDTAHYHYIAWKQLAQSLSLDIDEAFNEELKGISRMESLEKILVLHGLEDEYSSTEKEALTDQKNKAYVKLIQEVTSADILPGINYLLEQAKKENLKLAVASASKNAPFILERLGVYDDFDVIVDPGTLSKGKPDPEIFLTAAASLALQPEECVGIEDAEAGVTAINRAGMLSVAVGESALLNHADLIFKSTSEMTLEKILEAFKDWSQY